MSVAPGLLMTWCSLRAPKRDRAAGNADPRERANRPGGSGAPVRVLPERATWLPPRSRPTDPPLPRRSPGGGTRLDHAYQDHGVLFCWQDGRPTHPDTITRRFKQLAAAAGLPEIDLNDVRHSYATAGRNARIDWKALSKRIGHADVAFTMKQYVQTDLEADRQVANTLAELIIGGSLASVEQTDAT